jgi:hypothetical protein
MKTLSVVLACLIVAQDPPGKTTLGWSPAKDEKVRYEITQRLELGDGVSPPFGEIILGVAMVAGEKAGDGWIPVTFTLERIATSTQSPAGERRSYDSATDKEPPADESTPRVYSKMIGKSLSGRLSPTGKVEAAEALAKVVQAAVDEWPDLKGRKKWGEEENLKLAKRLETLLNGAFHVVTGEPKAVGDSWEAIFEDKELTKGFGRIVRTVTFKGLKEGLATADVKVTFDLPVGASAVIKDATGEGTVSWDVKRGLLSRLATITKFKAAVTPCTHRLIVDLKAGEPAK